MKKVLIGITALLTVGFLATNAFSWGHGSGKRGGCGGQSYEAFANLTPEQKTQLKALKQKFIDDTYETRAALMNKHQEIRMLLETSSPSRAKLETLSDEALDLMKDMKGKLIDAVLEAKKIAPELDMSLFAGHRGGFGKHGFGKGGKGMFGPCAWKTQNQEVVQ
ncbi:MAG: periplasmic heavy metal sensor [Desulfobacterales bacterium]|nr:periplasmic heavy metal sensor [Desulfobacterales bacterium]